MAEDDSVERRVRKLAVDHAETRWLALRVDDDVKEMRADLREINRKLDGQVEKSSEHDGRFDSIDAQLRSLTQMVGKVLDRRSESDNDDTN